MFTGAAFRAEQWDGLIGVAAAVSAVRRLDGSDTFDASYREMLSSKMND